MKRRSFLGGLGAMVAGLFGCGRAAPAEYDPTIADRDKKGKCLSRIYRLAKDGCYYEIGRGEPRPGDRCIVLGLDGKRLWSAEAFTVGGPRGSFYHDGEPVVEMAATPRAVNLFDGHGAIL
jgi:hypothetical protein